MIGRRRLILGVAAVAAAGSVRAAETLTMLVGAASGSPVDEVVRAFVPFLARHLASIDLAVRNLPGGAGMAAANALVGAPADGSVLGWVATPTLPARSVDRGAEDLLRRIVLLGAV